MTITGTNFGTTVTDNPVSIVFNGGIGALPCIVDPTTLTTTNINCRVEPPSCQAIRSGEVAVFAKTSEEAKCADTICAVELVENSGSVTDIALSFDSTAKKYQLTFTGTNLVNQQPTLKIAEHS